jgi:hypothetical protein
MTLKEIPTSQALEPPICAPKLSLRTRADSTGVGSTCAIRMRASTLRLSTSAAFFCLLLASAPTSIQGATEYIHFSTLGPRSNLPSSSWCAEHVDVTPETVSTNTTFNHTTPSGIQLQQFYAHPVSTGPPPSDFFRVDGNYTGSTDMILRWAACKWGIDEDVVRAQAWAESKWKQGGVDPALGGGDRRFSIAQCVQGKFTALWNYACPGCCYQSWGILQTKVFYEWGTWPIIKDSTAFNADYRYADQRACMNGDYSTYFQSSAQQPNNYAPDVASQDLDLILWGCIGMHFSGSWYDPEAKQYLAKVQSYLATRPWEHLSGATSQH